MNNEELVVFTKPKSAIAESIRTLRTNLQFTLVDKNIKTIMITSSFPGEGKSFVSANLAAAFSTLGMRVLLMDCDLRRGRQRKMFKLEERQGLSNLLVDDIKNYKKYIRDTNIDNFDLLTSGTTSPNPSELLGSEKNKEFMKKLREDYDLIIMDCPPANAVSDTLVLTEYADEAVIVSAYKTTPFDLLLETKKTIESSNTKIAGVIINKMRQQGKNKYYYNSYYK